MSTLLSFNELWTDGGEINWCKWLRRIYDSAPATEDGGVGGGGGLFLISVGKFILCNKRQNSPGRSGVS